MEHVLALLEAGLRPEKDVRIRAELEIRQVLATGPSARQILFSGF